MNCAISKKQIERFGTQIAKDLLTNIQSDQPFDLKEYTQSIYNQVLDVSSDVNRALDYARLVPTLIEQITAFDREIKGNLLNKGFDFNSLANLAFGVQDDETGIGVIRDFLSLPNEQTIIEELGALNESNQIQGRVEEIAENQPVDTPVVEENTVPPVTRNLSGRVYDSILQAFRAAPPTAFADRNQEALNYSDKGSPNYNVPDPNQKFFYDIKRKILSELGNADYDSSQMDYQGYGGMYLTAVSVSNIEQYNENIDQAFLDDVKRFDPEKKGVILMITNKYGEPFLFDKDANITLDETGKIAHYKLRSTAGVFSEDGSVKLKTQDRNSIKAMARAQGITEAAATDLFVREIQTIEDLRKYISGTNNTVRSIITGGTFGYIEIDSSHRNKIGRIDFGNEIFRPEAATTNEQVPGIKKGQTYFQSDDIYGQAIVIERPYVKDTGLIDTIINLIVDDLVNEKGEPIEYVTRRNYLDNYVYKNDSRLQTGFSNTPGNAHYVLIDGKQYNLTTPEQKAVAKQVLNSYFNDLQLGATKSESELTPNQKVLAPGTPREQWNVNNAVPIMDNNAYAKNNKGERIYRIVDQVKLHINRDQLNQNFPAVSLTKTAGDTSVLKATSTPYNDFLKEHFYMDAELNAQNKLVKLNAHFTFQPLDEDIQKVYGRSTAEEITEKVTNTSVKEVPMQNENPGGSSLTIDQMISQGMGDEEFLKRFDQKNVDKRATLKQIQEAHEWYQNHPMSEFFPFQAAFDLVNSKDMNAVATWAMHGITLFKGADYSDLYHEAWHGFTQAFMTKEQKQELYKEVSKKTGSFTDYQGRQVQFSRANDLQLEEYLAEDFRSYMLSGQKTKVASPKRNNIFRKIWNFLRSLFENSTLDQVTTNDKSDQYIHDLYEKLRLGNLTEFTFSQENVSFGDLNKGINAWNADEVRQQLSYQQSQEIKDTIDSLFSEYIDMRNTGLTQDEMVEYNNLKNLMRNPDVTLEEKKQIRPKVEAFELRKSYKYTSSILKSPTHLKLAYTHARNRIAQLYQQKEKAYSEETNEVNKPLLKKQMDTLYWAFKNFGNLESIKENLAADDSPVKGVIGYHLMKSQFYFDETTALMLDDESITEDEKYLAGREGYDRGGNENSMRELASKEILYLIKGLNKVDRKGNVEYNAFGVPKLVKEQEVINRLGRVLENTLKAEDMEKKLIAEAKVYPPIKQLLSRMGPLKTGSKTEAQLWTAFWQTFNKSRIHLIQMTLEKTTDKINGNSTYVSKIGQAFNTSNKIARTWDSEFKTASPESSKYLKRDAEGNYLNISKVLDDFKIEANVPDNINLRGREFEFFKAIGITLTDTPEVKEEIKNSDIGADWFLSTLKTLNMAGVKVRSITDITKEYKGNLYNPITNRSYPGPKGLNRRLNRLTALESKYSDAVSNAMVTNAEGNTQFEHTLNNSLTMMVNSINNAANYQELISMPHMSHLDINKNYFAKASTWLNSIFDLSLPNGPKRLVDGNPVQITLTNLSGVLIQEENDTSSNGVASAKADEFTKFILDLHLVTQIGIPELMRHADKGTSYSASINKIFRTKGSKKSSEDRQYIMNRDFLGNNYHEVAFEMINPHIMAEAKRIKDMIALNNRIENGDDIGVYDYNYIKRGTSFVQFDDVLTESTKGNLLSTLNRVDDIEEYVNSEEGVELKNAIQTDLQKYFDIQVEKVTERFNQTPFIADSMINNIIGDGKNAGYNTVSDTQAKETLIKSFVYNSWIHNIESLHLFYGDLALYNHQKEEFHKRNAGMGSTGNLYRTDQVFQDYANSILKRSYTESLGLPGKQYTGTFDTAVVSDNEIGSAYYKEYLDAIQDVDAASAYDNGKMNEGDAQGWISFDSYRLMKEAEGSWSPAQERLFQDIVAGKQIDPKLITQFFPTVKAQYMGPLKQSENSASQLPVTAFHKFSLFPLIPTVVKGTNLEKLHQKMMVEGIDYVTFASGSKVGTLTKNGKTDSLYSDNKRTISDVVFTKNTIFMEYLKNQLEIAPKGKGSVIFATQLRKLIEDGLYEEGKALSGKFEALVKDYENNLAKLTEFKKQQLLKEANWTIGPNGQPEGKLEDLMRFVKRELSRQDLADHEIDFIQIGRNGQLKHDLSLSLSAEKIEKLLNSLVTKRLVKQKVNGEGLIQVSGAGFESIDSTLNRDYSNPTDEQRTKYGTNDLPTYHKKADGTTAAMKVKIALQGNFMNLLELRHTDGDKVGSIQRLNELIKNEEWLNTGNHRQMITMVGVRIPVQGLNSMEFMEVYEFLPAEAGNIIIPPAEIVAKAGSDFDIDKLTVMMPNISKNVKRMKLTNQILSQLQEANPDLDFSRDNIDMLLDAEKDNSGIYTMTPEDNKILNLLEQGAEVDVIYNTGDNEKGIQNALINNIKAILELPENFSSLIRPNGTDIVQPIAEQLQEYVQDYNPTDVINGSTRKGGKGKPMISPTRVFEVEYNLYKHASNNVGKQTLGLGAVDNTYNTVFNRIGAYLNPTSGTTTKEYNRIKAKEAASGFKSLTRDEQKKLNSYHRQTLFLDHNTRDIDGEKAISLSHLKDSEGKHKISDIINQMINGWVDIAKDTWIFNIQGNKEVAPTLLFMIQAGVPVEQAIYFASMPMVREYVKEQRLAKSTFADPLGKAAENPNFFKSKAREVVLTNPRFGFNIDPESASGNRQNKTINQEALARVNSKFNSDDFLKNIKAFATEKKKGNVYQYSDFDRNAFIHFLEVENMAGAVRDVKLRLNFDTTKSGTLFEAQNRIFMQEALREDARLPVELVDRILTDSPISSFYIQPFQLAIWKDVFKLRNNSTVNSFILDKIKNDRGAVNNTFGKPETFANEFRNDFVSYLFQDAVKSFNLNSKSYRGRIVQDEAPRSVKQVEDLVSLKFGAFVKDDILYVDKAKLRSDYLNKRYASEEYTNAGLIPVNSLAFSTADEYYNFVYEREHLRSIIPFQSISGTKEFSQIIEGVKDSKVYAQKENESAENYDKRILRTSYEVFLRNKALDNTHNHWKLFKSKDTYADQFMSLKAAYPELEKEFALVEMLSVGIGKGNIKNLKLNDHFQDGDSLNLLHENIQNLIQGNIDSVTDASDKYRISEFFRRFPVVAFLQSGMNTRSAFSLTRLVPQDVFTRVMEKPLKQVDQYLSKFGQDKFKDKTVAYLDEFYEQFVVLNQMNNRSSSLRGKNYKSELSIEQADRMLTQDKSRREVMEFGRFFDPLQTIGANLKGFDPDSIKTAQEAKELLEKNPGVTYIYNHAIVTQGNATLRDYVFAATGMPNALGLPTILSYAGGPASQYIKDVDGNIDPQIKEKIDIAIEDLKEQRDNGQVLAFNRNGYGQYMINASDSFEPLLAPATYVNDQGNTVTRTMAQRIKDGVLEYQRLKKTMDPKKLKAETAKIRKQNSDNSYVMDQNGRPVYETVTRYYVVSTPSGSNMPAPQTFLYLSKRLFEEFGFINPNYLSTNTGRTVVQSTQPITDEQVRDFMNNCI